MLLEMDDLYENIKTNSDILKENKSKFDDFECQKINNAKTDN